MINSLLQDDVRRSWHIVNSITSLYVIKCPHCTLKINKADISCKWVEIGPALIVFEIGSRRDSTKALRWKHLHSLLAFDEKSKDANEINQGEDWSEEKWKRKRFSATTYIKSEKISSIKFSSHANLISVRVLQTLLKCHYGRTYR